MTELDALYQRIQGGDHDAFASWIRLCELPLRKGLRTFAPAVDVEAIVQEALLRIWLLARTLKLEGENASLRYAQTLARNLALSEARRLKRVNCQQIEGLENTAQADVIQDSPPDEQLRQAIQHCQEKLPQQPRAALAARLSGDNDRALAETLGMRLNTFLQNIVRARKLMAECLRTAGIHLTDYLR